MLRLLILDCERSYNAPGGPVIKNPSPNWGDAASIPGSGRSPGGGKSDTPAFLPGKSYGQKSLAGYSSQGCKELTEQLSTHVLYILVYTSPLAAGDEEKVTSYTRVLPAVLSYGDQSPWW